MWHRSSRWTLAAFAFAVVAGFIAWLILGRGERTHRLPDGREFSIVAVTYGTNHVLEEGPPWARLIARLGSRSMATRFGYRSSGVYSTALPSVMVWTRWFSGNSNSAPQFSSVGDVRGTETEPTQFLSTETVTPKRNGAYVAWRFENYPRVQKEFALRFYEYDLFRIRARREGEVRVRNPAPFAALTGFVPVAPVTATNGVLDCTLLSLTCGGAPPKRPLTAKNAIAPWATAEFEFREDGLPTSEWTVKRLEAFGSTGNYFTSDRLVIELENGRRVAHFTGAFWRDETDWRLVAEVAPTRNFPAESLWTVRLPTSAFGHETLRTNFLAPERGLRDFRLAVGPANVDMRGEVSPERLVAILRANFTPAAPDLYVDIAGAVDDRGRDLRIRSFVPRTGACDADVTLLASAEFVDLTFAIHRSRRLEFRVRPQIISTNAPVNKP
jgi:hypothetical protein